MENIVIEKTTYQVQRVFVGSQNVAELIQQRVCSAQSKIFPLTNCAPIPYNEYRDCSIVRRTNGT